MKQKRALIIGAIAVAAAALIAIMAVLIVKVKNKSGQVDLTVNGSPAATAVSDSENLAGVDVPTLIGFTIDSGSGVVKENSSRRAVTEFIPIRKLETLSIESNEQSKDDQNGYMIFEYLTPKETSYLGVNRPMDSFYWVKDRPVITEQDLIHEDCKYIRLVFKNTKPVKVTEFYRKNSDTDPKNGTQAETGEGTEDLIAESSGEDTAATAPADRPDYSGKVLKIAYSDIHIAPINTLEHFLIAAHLEFDALKGDVRLTGDGALVMCHDDGFTLNSSGRIIRYDSANCIKIHDMTASECIALKHDKYYYDLGHDARPCTLDQYLAVCKQYDKIPFITIRNDYPEETIAALLKSLTKYNLKDAAIINCMGFAPLNLLRVADSTIAMNYTLNHNEAMTIEQVDRCAELGNCSISLFTANDASGDEAFVASEPVIRYAKSIGVRVQNAQVPDMKTYLFQLKKGIDGLQIIRSFQPYERVQISFLLQRSGQEATIRGWFTNKGYLTADTECGDEEITLRNVYQNGSDRYFADGIPDLWMNCLPYDLTIRSRSGQDCAIEWRDGAFHISADDIQKDDVYEVVLII